MSTIRGYAKLHKGDMFEYYYGFLCVRHLIRMTSSVFADAGGLTTEDIEFLIDLLWGSRKSVLPLCFKGLLPGFPVLLFLLYNMTDYTDLLDPTLAGSPRLGPALLSRGLEYYERNILRQVSRWIHDKVLARFRTVALDYVPVDDDDARGRQSLFGSVIPPILYLSHLLCFWCR
ncbi:MYND Zn-finger protein [Rhizoctonia solani]|uniref:MYND Zn-finger protein n=1 Tax=Rhizoctonia solani TaxID=456999 RepID=A0A8H8NZG5_9AGAM|nr:MYND Zn-finger protein [Rhizoctonia solani]QRW21171.1 MYND Zn-finger protein [Rhizoctonia solani]